MVKITLKNIISALVSLDIPTESIDKAVSFLEEMLQELDEVPVKGRQNVDTLLGCMMAIEAIIGEDGGEVNG
jgi:prefoldin subunit 5